GDGGFGGGGGGRIADPGGHGGFGGGGGGGVSTGPFGGLGGFGGGNAAGYGFATNAGGGLGAGGDIFIQEGGRLTIEGGSVLNQAVVNPGGAGAGAQPGRAYGDGVFIQGNQSLVLAPAAGQSLSINGVIADMTGSKDQSGETGAGSVVVDGGGVVALAADNTFTGGVVLQHGTLSLHGAPQGAGSGTITFAPAVDSVLVVSAGPTAVANPITGFTTGDRLLFDNIGFVAGQSTAVISKGTLTYTAPSGHASLLLNGIADGTAFAASSAGAGGSFVELSAAQPAPCFLQGTRILTPDGEVAVEDLRFGDLVLTHDDTPARVIWVGQRTVSCAAHPHPERVWPVRISAGAFGRGRPRRDLFLSPDHCLYLDQVLIPVKCLIDGQAIAQVKLDALTYYHVELPRHGVLLAEGLESESYLDSNGRSNFGNGGTVLRLFPDFASVSDDAALLWEALACAPRRVTGPEVAAVRRRLSRRRRAAGGTGRRRKA
ncbi:MAG: Hint domain-containing protein, partial [Acetobacteraceae bacterium]